jgi:hypothetical protein
MRMARSLARRRARGLIVWSVVDVLVGDTGLEPVTSRM